MMSNFKMLWPCLVGIALFTGCEGDGGYPPPGGPDVEEAFSEDSKPVGDPSREAHRPEHTGPALEIPAGERLPAGERGDVPPGPPDAPAPQLKDQ